MGGPEFDLEKAQREETRWRIMRALDAGRPLRVSETLLLRVLADIDLPVTPHEVRRELDYLEERKLVEVTGKEEGTWLANLTRMGIDIVEYTVPCDPGIARPPRR
jgi:hypothetical protein